MTIKFIFHLLAILSGIVATAYGLSSAHNRVVIAVVFFSITGIFELAIPFLSKPFSLPEPFYVLRYTKEKYSPGIEVCGIKWEEDYLLYEFKFMNNSNHSEMTGIRLKFEVPGLYVAHSVSSSSGVENVNISTDDESFKQVDSKTKMIINTMKYKTNLFRINISKAYPQSYLTMYLVFQKVLDPESLLNYFTMSYTFEKEENKKEFIIEQYRIGNKDDIYDLFIDKSTKIFGESKHTLNIVPIAPIKIENKKKTIKNNPPNHF